MEDTITIIVFMVFVFSILAFIALLVVGGEIGRASCRERVCLYV